MRRRPSSSVSAPASARSARAPRRPAGHDVPRPGADGGDHVLRPPDVVRGLLHRLIRGMPMVPLLDDNILLIKPAPGLMIWTLVTFLIVLYILKRLAFGRIAELLETRRRAVQDNLEAAESARNEAQHLLDEYRQQLSAARHEASEIVERA